MSKNQLSFRLLGKLPPLDDVTALLGVTPTYARKQGEPTGRGDRLQPVDVWIHDFTDWWNGDDIAEATVRQIAEMLTRFTPALATLDRSRCSAQLWLSTAREHQQGGFSVPPEIIRAAGAAGLGFEISILVDWPEDGV